MGKKSSRREFRATSAAAAAVGVAAGSGVPAMASVGRSSFDTERFVDDVRQANLQGQSAVNEVLARAVEKPNDVLQGLGEPAKAGLQVLHRDDDLTILNVIWAPLMVLLPHDHNMWASIGIYTGREDNILWQRDGAIVSAKGAASLSEREVFGLGADGIHSVINPIPRFTGAIHIYGGDFFAPGRKEWDAQTLEERPFDVEALKKNFQNSDQRFRDG